MKDTSGPALPCEATCPKCGHDEAVRKFFYRWERLPEHTHIGYDKNPGPCDCGYSELTEN